MLQLQADHRGERDGDAQAAEPVVKSSGASHP
jgi:hypothetical protein